MIKVNSFESRSPFRKLSIKDLEKFYGCSHVTAVARKRELRESSGRETVRVYDLANYEMISCQEVYNALK